MSGRGPWHHRSSVAQGGSTPLGRALLGALTRLAKAGEPMPSNMVLAAELDCGAEAISKLLTIQEREGTLIVEKRGKTCGLQRRVTIVATDLSTAPIGERVPTPRRRARERFTLHSHPVPKGPAVSEDLRVERDRCPMCELPPHHAECRHGWNGLTTLRQRRAIAAETGIAS